jgi:hypothetical protein
VFAAWIWTYFTFTRGARLITGDQRLAGWNEMLAEGPGEGPGETPVEKVPAKAVG